MALDTQNLSSALVSQSEREEKMEENHRPYHHHQHSSNNKHTPELDLNQVAEEDVKGDEETVQQAWPNEATIEEKEEGRQLGEKAKDETDGNKTSPGLPTNHKEGKTSGKRYSKASATELSPRNNGSVSRVHRSRSRSLSNSGSPKRRRSSPANGRQTLSRSPDRKHGHGHGHGRRSTSPDGRHGSHFRGDERRRHDRNNSSPGRSRIGRSRSRSPMDRRSSPYHDRDRYHRSRYSPRRRSPARYPSRRDYSPRRRPWSPPPNRNTGVGKPGNNLFVAGFSFGTSERDLEKKFSRYGHVTDVRIIRDRRSGDSRGFGFLSLESDEDADAAIRALDQTEWNGRIVLVEKAKTS